MTSDRTPLSPTDVRSDAEQPRQHFVFREVDVPASPALEKHDGGQILRARPVARPPEAVVVDGTAMPLEESAEGLRIPTGHRRPELRVASLAHHQPHVRRSLASSHPGRRHIGSAPTNGADRRPYAGSVTLSNPI